MCVFIPKNSYSTRWILNKFYTGGQTDLKYDVMWFEEFLNVISRWFWCLYSLRDCWLDWIDAALCILWYTQVRYVERVFSASHWFTFLVKNTTSFMGRDDEKHTHTLDEGHTSENFTLKWNICWKNTGGRQRKRSCDVVVGRLVGLGILVFIFSDVVLRDDVDDARVENTLKACVLWKERTPCGLSVWLWQFIVSVAHYII